MADRFYWEGNVPHCDTCGLTHAIDGQGRVDLRCPPDPDSTEPDWNYECEVCGCKPIVPATGLCGPCTFGEADTINGNW